MFVTESDTFTSFSKKLKVLKDVSALFVTDFISGYNSTSSSSCTFI